MRLEGQSPENKSLRKSTAGAPGRPWSKAWMETPREAVCLQESKFFHNKVLLTIIIIKWQYSSDVGISDLEQGYCFLENILDFTQPERNCYEDVAWSEVDGRFWSNIACVEEHRQPQPCLSTLNKPCIFPFTFQGETFNGCTHRGSENGAAWCATEVSALGLFRFSWTKYFRLMEMEMLWQMPGRIVKPAAQWIWIKVFYKN